MKRFNRADQVLCLAALLFVFCLILKLKYQDALFARALFFISEAALVGGIADWFAVTALFCKPLGFPYHTALLPRQRERFINACTRMIQDEFFSRKKLLQQIKNMNFPARFMEFIERGSGKTQAAAFMVQFLENITEHVDEKKLAAVLEKELAAFLERADGALIGGKFAAWSERNRVAEALLDEALRFAEDKLSRPEARESIGMFLRSSMAAKTPGLLGGILSILAEAANVVNFDEAADILQRRLLELSGAAQRPENPLRRRLALCLNRAVFSLSEDDRWHRLIECFSRDMGERLSLRYELAQGLRAFFRLIKRRENAPEAKKALVVISPLAAIAAEQVEGLYAMLQKDASLRREIEDFVNELLCRSVLEAQSMVGAVVKEAFAGLSDEELNRLVYEKVEQDMIWLRMNGSIVGAAIGAGIFAVLELAASAG